MTEAWQRMRGARFLRGLHLVGWLLRPWRWSTITCHGINDLDEHRTVRVSCRCGRVFGEAADPRAQLIIAALDLLHTEEAAAKARSEPVQAP